MVNDKQTGINPAILVSFWAGEQGFSYDSNDKYDPDRDMKAFGCSVTGPGVNSYPSFEGQVKCVLDQVQNAINKEGNYREPEIPGTWDRLIYHYIGTEDQKVALKTYGHVTTASNTRIKILKKLVPDQVTCAAIQGASTSNKIVGAARGQVGYKTQKSDCAIYNEKTIDESRQYQWCVSFVSWVYRKAGHNVPLMVGTEEIMNYFKNEQTWIERKDIKSANDIKAGDVLIETSASSSSGKHAGIIDIENGRYFTIEGNTSKDMVERREIGDMNAFVRNLVDLGRIKE